MVVGKRDKEVVKDLFSIDKETRQVAGRRAEVKMVVVLNKEGVRRTIEREGRIRVVGVNLPTIPLTYLCMRDGG